MNTHRTHTSGLLCRLLLSESPPPPPGAGRPYRSRQPCQVPTHINQPYGRTWMVARICSTDVGSGTVECACGGAPIMGPPGAPRPINILAQSALARGRRRGVRRLRARRRLQHHTYGSVGRRLRAAPGAQADGPSPCRSVTRAFYVQWRLAGSSEGLATIPYLLKLHRWRSAITLANLLAIKSQTIGHAGSLLRRRAGQPRQHLTRAGGRVRSSHRESGGARDKAPKLVALNKRPSGSPGDLCKGIGSFLTSCLRPCSHANVHMLLLRFQCSYAIGEAWPSGAPRMHLVPKTEELTGQKLWLLSLFGHFP